MYKKFTLEQLLGLKTEFFTNFKKLYERRRYPTLKTFLKDLQKEWRSHYFFFRGSPLFRVVEQENGEYLFVDEKEKIELKAGTHTVNKLHSMLKDARHIKRQTKGSKRMRDILWDDFNEGNLFKNINGKPYLVYDIETPHAGGNLKDLEFYLAYAYVVDENGVGTYKFVGPDSLQKFVQFMLDFDGYVVWFNNLYFDNPVSVYNVPGWTQDMVDRINAKSVDLFIFLRNLTGKRMGLNRIAQALVGVEKTLESGAEGETLMKLYEETRDQKYYTKFKKYCKNDVEMTVLVLFYLLKNQKVYLEDAEYSFTLEEFYKLSKGKINKTKKAEKSTKSEKIFW